MTQLTWNDTGARYFEAGVDRGVLYTFDGTGVAWNGLTAVTESPSGGEPTPYYLDGVKYLNVAASKEFGGTIEAFTYPEEFSEYDGWVILDNGLAADEQQRKPFGLSYRTRLGNDISGTDHGYKIHIIYNALAAPTESAYSTLSDDLDPISFSWSITTKPGRAISSSNLSPLSHVVIDSTKTNPTQLRFIEEVLYGTETQAARLITFEEIFDFFEHPMVTLTIQPDLVDGLASLLESETVFGDLRGRINEGLYVAADNSRLVEKSTPGLYLLASSGYYFVGP